MLCPFAFNPSSAFPARLLRLTDPRTVACDETISATLPLLAGGRLGRYLVRGCERSSFRVVRLLQELGTLSVIAAAA